MNEKEKLRKTGEMFKLLGDPTRLKILLTMEKGEKCVHEIAEEIDHEISNISHHLRRMKDQNLVEVRREGRHKYYSLKDEHILSILKEGISHAEE